MAKLTVVGVGLTRGELTLAAAELLGSGARVLLHTDRIECADYLREKGIPFESLDALYDESPDFEEHARRAAQAVLASATEADTVYAVYDIRDRSVEALDALGAHFDVLPGVPTEGALYARAEGLTRMASASDWENMRLSGRENTLIRELDSRALAGEVKLKLLEVYPDETRVFIRFGDGRVARAPLYDLDRLKGYDHRCCVLVPAVRGLTALERYGLDELREIMHILQGENGCAWDKVQTHETLRRYLLEESCEAIDAIDEGDAQHLCEELGDLLMQIVMHAELGAKHGEFTLDDVADGISRKMIERHTHVFGEDRAQDPEAVLKLWTQNKMHERGQKAYSETLREVSRTLPALLRGIKLCEKAARAGVAPANAAADVRAALEAYEAHPGEATAGDLLLMLCARLSGEKTDAESALHAAENRFIERFAALEASGRPLSGGDGWDCVKSTHIVG